MRFTIERMRTLVLAAGVLLVGALVMFLAFGKWKKHFNIRQALKPLGIDIQQEANGYTLSHAFGAHSQYKIHASKVVQLKNNRAILHDVKIELYDTQGGRVDRIEGGEFEYDQKTEIATAAGPVEITLMRPGVAPAIAPKATPGKVLNPKGVAPPLATAVETAEKGEIHVKTSGLTFDYKNGVSTTSQRVDFSMMQGTGNSIGATYDSKLGHLVLDHAVELELCAAAIRCRFTLNMRSSTAPLRTAPCTRPRPIIATAWPRLAMRRFTSARTGRWCIWTRRTVSR